MTKTLFWRCVTSEKNIVYLPRYQRLGERPRHQYIEMQLIFCCLEPSKESPCLQKIPCDRERQSITKRAIKLKLFLDYLTLIRAMYIVPRVIMVTE